MTFQCRFKEMGLAKCADTVGRACESCRKAAIVAPRPVIGADFSAGRVVLTGTPNGSSGPFFAYGSPTSDWHREYMGAWATARTVLEAEEQRQRSETTPCARCGEPTRKGGIHFCMAMWKASMGGSRIDHHVEALQYALSGRQGGKREAMTRLRQERTAAGHSVAVLSGSHTELWQVNKTNPGPCAKCGATADDRCTHLPRGESPKHYCFPCAETLPWAQPAPPEPKPPTLREWLGDHVSELGPWADVLREQPVPAGYLSAWRWDGGRLKFADSLIGEWCTVLPDGFSQIVEGDTRPPWMGGDGGCQDFMLKAFFTRHPAVKPEPRKATLRTWFGNEEEP